VQHGLERAGADGRLLGVLKVGHLEGCGFVEIFLYRTLLGSTVLSLSPVIGVYF
jgi:hypothetical protein